MSLFENATVVTGLALAALVLAYFVYGRFLARWVFQLDPNRQTPAYRCQDGVDYVPARVPVLFGHHFASIAGLGPIIGPAIAVYWGWLPAIAWIVLGSALAGAVHDLGALSVSLRFRGRTIGDVTRELAGPRARLLFLIVIFFALALAMGVFVAVIAKLFISSYSTAVIPSLGLMVVAVGVGVYTYKFAGSWGAATVVALALFAGLIVTGVQFPLDARVLFAGDQEQAGAAAQKMWVYSLLVYAFVASVLPVWLLLQPRDYINSFQLYLSFGLLLVGIFAAGVLGLLGASAGELATFQVPPIRQEFPTNSNPPPMFPLLFVTIACGAVSGFHCMVASGTTSRQLSKETDALPIAYGGMLTEGGLAVLVVMACTAGVGLAAWSGDGLYAGPWKDLSQGALGMVINGGAAYLSLLGIPVAYGGAFLAVTIVSFALTTLDSGTRLLRYNTEEIFRSLGWDTLANRYVASTVAVGAIAAIALIPGGTSLWVLFGATNQLLAGLTLLAVSLFLFKLGRSTAFTLLPMAAMLMVTGCAMGLNMLDFWRTADWFKLSLAGILLGMTLWLIIEAALAFSQGRTGLSFDDSDDAFTTSPSVDSEAREAQLAADAAHVG